jgi:cytochrome c553
MISVKLKSKKVFLLLSVISLLFTGCGDDSKEPVITKEKTTQAPIIEVVENKNAKEIKVKEKTAPDSQSKSYYLNYNVKSAYDENSQPANKDASVRVKPRTLIDAQLNVRSPYEKVKISLLVRKLSKKFIIKCSACHNDYANGIIGPSLLDKTSDEILKKIAEFKSGKKSNPLMNDLIKMMSEDEIKDMADEIYSFNQEIKKLGK